LEAEVAHELDELVGGAEGVVEEARVLVLEDPGECTRVSWKKEKYADGRCRCALAE
jgi:hypothetical protein